jgi:tetratricopeptide (TPR) repeat protein
MRRGLISEANASIDRSLALDSTFALALVEATVIKSWLQYVEGRLVPELLNVAERAVTHSEPLSERNRQRARTVLASIRTDGVAAAEASERILRHDSTDLEAWASLAYSHQAYGWQYGKVLEDAKTAAERVVQLDSTHIPGLVVRAELASVGSDSGDVLRQMGRLRLADTTNNLVRGAILGLRAILDSEDSFSATASDIAKAPLDVWTTAYRLVRTANPERADQIASALEQTASPGIARSTAIRARARMLVAQGRFEAVDSMILSGVFQGSEFEWTLDRMMAAASVAGLVPPSTVARAIGSLTASVPIDSALAYLTQRPVLRTGWVLAAFHATHGDAAVAGRWRSLFGEFPAGGPQTDYRRSLQMDLDSRLAERGADSSSALELAQQAFDLWSIHSSNALEDQPEPAMRFHLASLLRQNGREEDAVSMFRSLTPPSTWMGFLCALAMLELGELAEARGDSDLAARHYRAANAFWDHGGAAVTALADRAASGMTRAGVPH